MVPKVPVWKDVTLSPNTETSIVGIIATQNYLPLGMIEGLKETGPVAIAASLNKPDPRGKVVMRCLNPDTQPLTLKTGSGVELYSGVEDTKVQDVGAPDHMETKCTEVSTGSFSLHLWSVLAQRELLYITLNNIKHLVYG